MRRRTAPFLILVPFLFILGWAAAGSVLAGGGCHQQVEASASEATAATTIKLDGCTYAPSITRVPVGTEVRWVNASGQRHDVTGRKFEWGSGDLLPGASYSQRFTKAGVFPYSCSFHPGMAGMVVVGSTAAAVVPAADATPASAAPDLEAAAAVEPATASSSAGGSAMPLVAAGAIGLLAGLAIGILGGRSIAGRHDAT